MDYRKPRPELYEVPWTTDSFNGMPYRTLGRSGLRASSVGLGLWKIGYPETGDGSRVDEKRATGILDRAVELGVTFWDTANRYNNGSGNSERIIGTWFERNPDQRRNVVLATKIFGGMDGTTPNHSGLSRTNILDAVYASLARLRTDHIDLLYFHSWDPRTPVEESLEAVEDLAARDLVRYFGVSNFTVERLEAYRVTAAGLSRRCAVVSVQNHYDILAGPAEEGPAVLEYCAAGGPSFIAWSPLARGLLTERYLDAGKAGPGDRLFDEGTLAQDVAGSTSLRLQKLAALARSWDLRLNQLALAYMLSLPGMGPVIPSSTSIEQLESNAAAGKVTLSAEQQAQVRAALQSAG